MWDIGALYCVSRWASAQLSALVFREQEEGSCGLLPFEILTYLTEEISIYIKEDISCSIQTYTVLALTAHFPL